jgi:SAM-dependent methyltransferase
MARRLPDLSTLRAELEAAQADIARLRRERDEAIQGLDRAVSALHRATPASTSDRLGASSEYAVVPRWRPLDYPGIVIETEASDADISAMCSDVAASWSAMGEREPFFTNVSYEDFTMANIAKTKDEFFGSGSASLIQLRAIARRQGIDLLGYRDCFELGCGVGRLTSALAGAFDRVHAMDVSTSHLRVAQKELAHVRSRVELYSFESLASIEALPRFDLFVSFAVLQHNPPPLAAKLLDRILTKVRVGGAACFQCQTYQRGYRFCVTEYLQGRRDRLERQPGAQCGWEMHCLPQSFIYDALRRNGFSLLEVREDAGQAYGISQVFFAVRDRVGREA